MKRAFFMDFKEYNKLVDKINLDVSEELERKGFYRINRIWDGSLFVCSAYKEKEKQLVKIPSYDLFDVNSYKNEILFLERLKGLEGITHLVEELRFSFSLKYIQPNALVKEYAKGNIYTGQYLSSKQEQKVMNTIKEIHKEGIADLDIKLNNYIYFPERGLTFIDPIYDETKELKDVGSIKERERLKAEDLKSLEYFFEIGKVFGCFN